jgi:hypothetical protein
VRGGNEANDAKVLRALVAAADRGLPCPTNPQLCDLIGAGSPSAPVRALDRLATCGLIRVERFQTDRRVTIISTGRSTAYHGKGTPHWREQVVVAAADIPSSVLTGARLATIIRSVAHERGVTLTQLLQPTGLAVSIVGNLSAAKAPKPVTIARLLPVLGDALRAFDLPALPPVEEPSPARAAPSLTIAVDPCSSCGARDGEACGCARSTIVASAAPSRAALPRPKGRPRTFEEQLAAVAAGAGLIEVRPLRRPPPQQTLGGVGSSLL